MPTVISKDGTSIAYTNTGSGPGLILVNGALSHRNLYGEQDLANLLASKFSVFYFDRRGRGESGDVQPYFVQNEIDDIEALIDKAGGLAYVYGTSSGAALSLLAADKLGAKKIKKLALYEPPYSSAKADYNGQYNEARKQISDLLAAGRYADAVTIFFKIGGLSDNEIQELKNSPMWEDIERTGTTLSHDLDILSSGVIPAEIAKRINIPTLIVDGEKSLDFMHATANELAEYIPDAKRQTLKGQTHQAAPDVIAKVLLEFFNAG